MKVNIIDGSNIFFICYSILQANIADECKARGKEPRPVEKKDIPELLDIFVMKLKLFLNQRNNIVCFEGKNSSKWRKDIYPEYKGNRNRSSEDALFDCLEECQKICKYLPCKVMKVENCEGDDVMFALAERIITTTNHDVELISSDEDWTQVEVFFPGRVQCFHPIKKEYRVVNPKIVQEKVYVGDGSDNIKFKKGLGPKTLEKMRESKAVYDKWVSSEEDKEKLRRIHKIVDLRCFPLEYRKSIIKSFNEEKYNKTDYEELSKKLSDFTINCIEGAFDNRARRCVEDDYIESLPEPFLELDSSDVWIENLAS